MKKKFIKAVIKGVPQGCVLEQIYFCNYVNDLTEALKKAKLLVFTDNTTLNVKTVL